MNCPTRHHRRLRDQRIILVNFSSLLALTIGLVLIFLLNNHIKSTEAFTNDSVTYSASRKITPPTLQQRQEQSRKTSMMLMSRSFIVRYARRPGRNDGDDYDQYYDDDDDDQYYDDDYGDNQYRRSSGQRRRRRRQQPNDDNEDDGYDYLGGLSNDRRDGLDIPSSYGRRDGWRLPESVSKALLAGALVVGVGLGVAIDSAINTNPRDLASRDAVDQAAPNSLLCARMGASAMAFDQRVFVSFNPFNVYVAQADVKPACVLRQSNIVPILRDRNLINDNEVRSCKANMNTWAFVGNLDDSPQLSCVYKSEDAQNEFLSNPKFGIGEDYLDDDRAKAEAESSKKKVKSDMTQGQRDAIVRQQQQQRAMNMPGVD